MRTDSGPLFVAEFGVARGNTGDYVAVRSHTQLYPPKIFLPLKAMYDDEQIVSDYRLAAGFALGQRFDKLWSVSNKPGLPCPYKYPAPRERIIPIVNEFVGPS